MVKGCNPYFQAHTARVICEMSEKKLLKKKTKKKTFQLLKRWTGGQSRIICICRLHIVWSAFIVVTKYDVGVSGGFLFENLCRGAAHRNYVAIRIFMVFNRF